jgi:hypothetical protein
MREGKRERRLASMGFWGNRTVAAAMHYPGLGVNAKPDSNMLMPHRLQRPSGFSASLRPLHGADAALTAVLAAGEFQPGKALAFPVLKGTCLRRRNPRRHAGAGFYPDTGQMPLSRFASRA